MHICICIFVVCIDTSAYYCRRITTPNAIERKKNAGPMYAYVCLPGDAMFVVPIKHNTVRVRAVYNLFGRYERLGTRM